MVVLFSENNSEGGLMQSDIMKPWNSRIASIPRILTPSENY
jgi:hypothetical protein